jgi:fucose permease
MADFRSGITRTRERLQNAPTVVATAMVYLAFGVPTSMLGVMWPQARVRFEQNLGGLGWVILAYGVGRLSTATIGRSLIRRYGMGRSFLGGIFGLAVACTGLAVSVSWPMFLAFAALLGAMCGELDSVGSVFITSRSSAADAGRIHGSYGLGATMGPILVAIAPNWRVAMFGGLAAVAVATFANIQATDQWPPPIQESNEVRVPTPVLAVGLSVALLGTLVGIEVTIGQWAHTYLTDGRNLGDGLAAVGVSGFWLAATISRVFMSRPTMRHMTEPTGIAQMIALGGGLLLVLTVVPAYLAIALLAVAGFVMAPIVPSLFSKTARRVGLRFASRASGWQLVATNIGALSIPAAVGQLVDRTGPDAILYVAIAALALVALPLTFAVNGLPDLARAK